MHIFQNLPPEALTVLFTTLVAVVVLLAFALYPRLRRVKDESHTWDDPVFCIWRCETCGAEAVIAADTFEDAKAAAPNAHDELLTENAPVLLHAYRHHILVTQGN